MLIIDDLRNTIQLGHVLDVLKAMPSESVSCVVTSPPYWSLRDYGSEVETIWDGDENCEHEWENQTYIRNNDKTAGKKQNTNTGSVGRDKPIKHGFCTKCGAWKGQLGLEPTFELYIKHLCDIFDEIKRVLRKDGTCFVNLGDSYGGSGNRKGHTPETSNLNKLTIEYGATNGNQENTKGLEKSLVGIPERFSLEMRNRGWILRNTIIWYKPNCMPSSAKDRFTVDFEYVYFFVKSRKYWFEQQRMPYKGPLNRWGGDTLKRDTSKTAEYKDMQKIGHSSAFRVGRQMRPDESGSNMRTVWKITTKGYKEAHFATYPVKLILPMIRAGCPQYVCSVCGLPKVKIYNETPMVIKRSDWAEKSGNRTASSGTMLEPNEKESHIYTIRHNNFLISVFYEIYSIWQMFSAKCCFLFIPICQIVINDLFILRRKYVRISYHNKSPPAIFILGKINI